MICDLFHAKVVWMPSVYYISNYQWQNTVFVFGATFAEWRWQVISIFSWVFRD